MDASSLVLETAAGVATLTLNRPERLNATTVPMLLELRRAVDRVAADPAARCVVLTGAGRGFCAGHDLTGRKPGTAESATDIADLMDRHYNPIIRVIRNMQKPVICAVNGVAAGGGANLALAGDIVIAARSAYFVQSFCKLGVIPDCGGTYYLPRLVGRARALGLALLGDRLDAEQAAQWGLIWKCVDDAALMSEVSRIAWRLAGQPTRAFGLMKQAFEASLGNSLDAQLDLERDLQRVAEHSADGREGIAAFYEKRKPVFTGH